MCGVDTESVDVFLQSLRWEKHIPALCTTGHLLSMCDCHKAFGDALHVERVQFPASANNCILALCVRWCVKRHACLLAFSVFGVAYILLPGESQPTHHDITKQDILSVPWFTCPPWLFFGQGCSSSQRKWLSIQSPYSPPGPSVFWRENLPKKTMLTNTKKTEVIAAWDWKNSSTDIQMYGVTHLMLTCLSVSATFRPRQRCLANLAN